MAFGSGQAAAVGFGEITLNSRIGEPLRAEVSLNAAPQEGIETACFSLATGRDPDLPSVTAARMQLIRDGSRFRLIIAGSKPIADPVFVLALRAGCGVELQREFVLMPQAPLPVADAPAPVAEITTPPVADAGPTRVATAPPAAASEPKPRPRRPANPAKAPAGDRLVLGAPPADFEPKAKTPTAPKSLPEMQARMAQMESTLLVLNQELSKLNQAIELTTQVLASQQAAQTAGSVQKASLQAPPPPPPPPQSTAGNWLELAVSALVGGLIAAIAAYGVARRRKRSVEEELPLAVQMSIQRMTKAPAQTELHSLF